MPLSYEPLVETIAALRSRYRGTPRWGLILGSGLGAIAEQVESPVTIPYTELPRFPRSTVIGHRGQLVCGRLFGQATIVMQGRFHLYEGWTPDQVALPVRLMRAVGVETLVVTNASGGLLPHHWPGSLVVIDDHVNLMQAYPRAGSHEDSCGRPARAWIDLYDPRLIERVEAIGRQAGIALSRGIYAGVRGPNYEPRAEYRMLRALGADLVGMSTICEVLAARQEGMRVLALSVVSNRCLPDQLGKTDGADVVALCQRAAGSLATLIAGVMLHEESR